VSKPPKAILIKLDDPDLWDRMKARASVANVTVSTLAADAFKMLLGESPSDTDMLMASSRLAEAVQTVAVQAVRAAAVANYANSGSPYDLNHVAMVSSTLSSTSVSPSNMRGLTTPYDASQGGAKLLRSSEKLRTPKRKR
jgi:hypothetical protein